MCQSRYLSEKLKLNRVVQRRIGLNELNAFIVVGFYALGHKQEIGGPGDNPKVRQRLRRKAEGGTTGVNSKNS